ncbi:MAG: hypothetical protein IJ545_02015 [Alphaproteobacteria bacterium]|nr:hypothetical protein [Alphaproteobacteria bacterium]
MVKHLQAIMDRVIIHLDETNIKTSGGILMTEDKRQAPTIGTVNSIGDQVKSVKVGDKVFFHIFDELETPEQGKIIVRERSILGKILEK